MFAVCSVNVNFTTQLANIHTDNITFLTIYLTLLTSILPDPHQIFNITHPNSGQMRKLSIFTNSHHFQVSLLKVVFHKICFAYVGHFLVTSLLKFVFWVFLIFRNYHLYLIFVQNKFLESISNFSAGLKQIFILEYSENIQLYAIFSIYKLENNQTDFLLSPHTPRPLWLLPFLQTLAESVRPNVLASAGKASVDKSRHPHSRKCASPCSGIQPVLPMLVKFH